MDTNSTSQMGISNQEFDAREITLAYEVGMNLSSEDKLWNFDFAVFWNEVDDYQFEKPTGTTDYFVDNAEEVEIFGFEAEISGRPTDQLFISLGYGLTDGEIKEHTGSSIVQTNVCTMVHNPCIQILVEPISPIPPSTLSVLPWIIFGQRI